MQLDRGGDSCSCKSAGDEADVGLFVEVDLLQVFIERIFKTSSNELRLGVIGETLLIEFALEILQRQGIVENYEQQAVVSKASMKQVPDGGSNTYAVINHRCRYALLDRRRITEPGDQRDCDSIGETHVDVLEGEKRM